MLSTFQIISVHMRLAPSVLNSIGSITKVDGCTFHYKQKVVLGICLPKGSIVPLGEIPE